MPLLAVLRAVHGELAPAWETEIVAVKRDQESRTRLSIHDDRETEGAAMTVAHLGDGQPILEHAPCVAAVVAAMHAHMFLPEQDRGVVWIVDDVMHALAGARRFLVDAGINALVLRRPRSAAVVGPKKAGRGNAHPHPIRILGV